MPARIAKGELDGKMKCRIWRKLHAEEAKRFDQVYELMGKTPGLSLENAFGVVQSGMSVEDFLARRARTKKKEAVREARSTVPAEAINAHVDGLVAEKAELAIVTAGKASFDVLTGVEQTVFVTERSGRLEKLQVVLLARRSTWEELSPSLERDPKLAQKPPAVPRQPEKRPVSDPRPFLELVGKPLSLVLRNGLTLRQPLRAVGPFDILIGEPGKELFVPLHAIVRSEVTSQPASPSRGELESPG